MLEPTSTTLSCGYICKVLLLGRSRPEKNRLKNNKGKIKNTVSWDLKHFYRRKAKVKVALVNS